MDILTKLITKDTDIILLTNENITLKDKYEILGYTSVLADYYVSYIYKNNNNIYYFKEIINYILENDMSKIWKQICIDYKLNQECSIYENINDYYKSKYNSQKKYIKQLIKDVQL